MLFICGAKGRQKRQLKDVQGPPRVTFAHRSDEINGAFLDGNSVFPKPALVCEGLSKQYLQVVSREGIELKDHGAGRKRGHKREKRILRGSAYERQVPCFDMREQRVLLCLVEPV